MKWALLAACVSWSIQVFAESGLLATPGDLAELARQYGVQPQPTSEHPTAKMQRPPQFPFPLPKPPLVLQPKAIQPDVPPKALPPKVVNPPMPSNFVKCGTGKYESDYETVKKMLVEITGFDGGDQSLVELGSPKGAYTAQYWLINKKGVAHLHLKATLDLTRPATACATKEGVTLSAGGYSCTLTRKGKAYYMDYAGHPEWNNNYKAASSAEIAR